MKPKNKTKQTEHAYPKPLIDPEHPISPMQAARMTAGTLSTATRLPAGWQEILGEICTKVSTCGARCGSRVAEVNIYQIAPATARAMDSLDAALAAMNAAKTQQDIDAAHTALASAKNNFHTAVGDDLAHAAKRRNN